MREAPDLVELLGSVAYSSRLPQRKVRTVALARQRVSPIRRNIYGGESHEPINHS
jgi:hypothetical protein